MVYNGALHELEPPEHIIYGDGDGAVNIESLRGCGDFLKNHEHHRLHRMWTRELSGKSHDGIISDSEAIELLVSHLAVEPDTASTTFNQRKGRLEHRRRILRKQRNWRIVKGAIFRQD